MPVKIALMVGLPSLALVLYFLNKEKSKNKSLSENFNSQEDYETVIKSRQTIIEIKVPSDCVSQIIGRQGANIKEIQRRTNTRINMRDRSAKLSDNNSKLSGGQKERILLIRGSKQDAVRAELEIRGLLLDMPALLTREFYVPDYACGRIIGRQGSAIKEICNLSSCKVVLVDGRNNDNSEKKSISRDLLMKASVEILNSDFYNRSNRRIISITGTNEQIIYAQELVLQKIKEEELMIEKKLLRNTKPPKASNKQPHSLYQAEYSSRSTSDFSISSNVNNEINNNSTSGFKSASCYSISEVNRDHHMIKPALVNVDNFLDSEDNMCHVYVTAVADPNSFWIQLADNYDMIKSLRNEMNEYYALNDKKSYFSDWKELKLDYLVGIQDTNGLWHRAEIKGFDEWNKELVDIYLVDSGESLFVEWRKLRRLHERFYEIPMQAIECSLDNVQKNESGEKWIEEEICHFEQMVGSCNYKKLKMRLVKFYEEKFNPHFQQKPKPPVYFYDKIKNCVNDILVQKGYAKYVVTPGAVEDMIKSATSLDSISTTTSTSSKSSFAKLSELLSRKDSDSDREEQEVEKENFDESEQNAREEETMVLEEEGKQEITVVEVVENEQILSVTEEIISEISTGNVESSILC